MKIAISAPTGFNTRELVTPLWPLLEKDTDITEVLCISPASSWRSELFSAYGDMFTFVTNPDTEAGHMKLYKTHQPDVVVTVTAGLDPNDTPILKAAQAAHIPTVTVIGSWDNVWKMERLKNNNQPYVLADHLVVWNTMMRDHLLRVFPELSSDHVSVIGAPRLDFFTHTSQIPSREELFERLGIPTDKRLIQVATTELYPMDYVMQALDTAQQQNDLPNDLHFLLTVHPGGNLERHQAYATDNSTVMYSFGRNADAPHPHFIYNPTLEDIYAHIALFKYGSLLINQSSTVAIESFLVDVPVINVKYGKRFDWWNWYRSMVYRDFKQHYRDILTEDASTVVHNTKQLINATRQYLDNPALDRAARQRCATKMVTTTDGTASQQVLDRIKRQATA